MIKPLRVPSDSSPGKINGQNKAGKQTRNQSKSWDSYPLAFSQFKEIGTQWHSQSIDSTSLDTQSDIKQSVSDQHIFSERLSNQQKNYQKPNMSTSSQASNLINNLTSIKSNDHSAGVSNEPLVMSNTVMMRNLDKMNVLTASVSKSILMNILMPLLLLIGSFTALNAQCVDGVDNIIVGPCDCNSTACNAMDDVATVTFDAYWDDAEPAPVAGTDYDIVINGTTYTFTSDGTDPQIGVMIDVALGAAAVPLEFTSTCGGLMNNAMTLPAACSDASIDTWSFTELACNRTGRQRIILDFGYSSGTCAGTVDSWTVTASNILVDGAMPAAPGPMIDGLMANVTASTIDGDLILITGCIPFETSLTFDLTITNTADASCASTQTVTLTDDCIPDDPIEKSGCACNDDEAFNMTNSGTGTFNETITVTGVGVNELWTVSSVTGATGIAVGDVLPETVPGTSMAYESAIFQHIDGVGYTIEVVGPFGPLSTANCTFTISNLCEYPEVQTDLLPEYHCSETPIDLSANALADAADPANSHPADSYVLEDILPEDDLCPAIPPSVPSLEDFAYTPGTDVMFEINGDGDMTTNNATGLPAPYDMEQFYASTTLLDFAALPPGSYTLDMYVIGSDDGSMGMVDSLDCDMDGVNETPDPANPGCKTSLRHEFEILDDIDLTAVAVCTTDGATPTDPNIYYVEVTNPASPDMAPYAVTIDGIVINVANGATEYFGPFTHSGSGANVLIAQVGIVPGCTAYVEVSEVLCNVTPDGNESGAYCVCNFNGLGNDVPGVILAQAEPGTFEIGGDPIKQQIYVLVDDMGTTDGADDMSGTDDIILDWNYTGLFTGLDNGSYTVYAINYCLADQDALFFYLSENNPAAGNQVPWNPFEDGLLSTGAIGPLADLCYTACEAEFDLDCMVPEPVDVSLKTCPMIFGQKEGMFDLSAAVDPANMYVMGAATAAGTSPGMTGQTNTTNSTGMAVEANFPTGMIYPISFHYSQADAIDSTGVILDAEAFLANDGTVVWARIKINDPMNTTGNNCCVGIARVTLEVCPSPQIPIWTGVQNPACFTDNSFIINLSTDYDWANGDVVVRKLTNAETPVNAENFPGFDAVVDFAGADRVFVINANANDIRVRPERLIGDDYRYGGIYRIELTIPGDATQGCDGVVVTEDITLLPSMEACFPMDDIYCGFENELRIDIEATNPGFDNLVPNFLGRNRNELSKWTLIAADGTVIQEQLPGVVGPLALPGSYFVGTADGDINMDLYELCFLHGPGLYTLNHELGVDNCATFCSRTFVISNKPVAAIGDDLSLDCGIHPSGNMSLSALYSSSITLLGGGVVPTTPDGVFLFVDASYVPGGPVIGTSLTSCGADLVGIQSVPFDVDGDGDIEIDPVSGLPIEFVTGGTTLQYNSPGCYKVAYFPSNIALCAETLIVSTTGQDNVAYVCIPEQPQPSFDMAEEVCWDGIANSTTIPVVHNSPEYGPFCDSETNTTTDPFIPVYAWNIYDPGTTTPNATVISLSATDVAEPTVTVTGAGSVELCLTETFSYTGCGTNADETCTETSCHILVVTETNVSVDASWTPISPDPLCVVTAGGAAANIIDLDALITGNTGGVFTGTGVTGTHPDYQFDPTGLDGQTINICYTVGNGAGCDAVECHNIEVLPIVDADINGANPDPYDICVSTSAQFDLTQLFTPGVTTTGGIFSVVDPHAATDPAFVGGVAGDVLYYDPNQPLPVTVRIRYTVGDNTSCPACTALPGGDDCYSTDGVTIQINGALDIAVDPPQVCLDLPLTSSLLDMTNVTSIIATDGSSVAPQIADNGATAAAEGYYLLDDPDGTGATIGVDGVIVPGANPGVVQFVYRHVVENPNGYDCEFEVPFSFENYPALLITPADCVCDPALPVEGQRVVDLGAITGGIAPYTIQYSGATLDLDDDGAADDTDGSHTGATADVDFGQLLINAGETNWSITVVDARGCEIARSGQCDPLEDIPYFDNTTSPICYTDGFTDVKIYNGDGTPFNITGATTLLNSTSVVPNPVADAYVLIWKLDDVTVGGNNHQAFDANVAFTDVFVLAPGDDAIRIRPDFLVGDSYEYAGVYRIEFTIPAAENTACLTQTIYTDVTIYPSMEPCFDLPVDDQVCASAADFELDVDLYNPTFADLAPNLIARNRNEMSVWSIATPTGATVFEGDAGLIGQADGDAVVGVAALYAAYGPGLYTINHTLGIDICQASCSRSFTIKDFVDADLLDDQVYCGSISENIDLTALFDSGTTAGGSFTIVAATDANGDDVNGTDVFIAANPTGNNIILQYNENGALDYTITVEYAVGDPACAVTADPTDDMDCYETDQTTFTITGGHSVFLDLPEDIFCTQTEDADGMCQPTKLQLYKYTSIEDVTLANLLIDGDGMLETGEIRFLISAVNGYTAECDDPATPNIIDGFIIDADGDGVCGSAGDIDIRDIVDISCTGGVDGTPFGPVDPEADAMDPAACPIIDLSLLNVWKDLTLTVRIEYNDGGCIGLAEDNIWVEPYGEAELVDDVAEICSLFDGCGGEGTINLYDLFGTGDCGPTTVCGNFKIQCEGDDALMLPNDPNDTNMNGSFDPADATYPCYDFTWGGTQVFNKLYVTYCLEDEGCNEDTDQAVVPICPALDPGVNFGQRDIVCTEGTPIDLNSVVTVPAGGTWYFDSTPQGCGNGFHNPAAATIRYGIAPGVLPLGEGNPASGLALPGCLTGDMVLPDGLIDPLTILTIPNPPNNRFFYILDPECTDTPSPCPSVIYRVRIDVAELVAETCQFFGDGETYDGNTNDLIDHGYCSTDVPAAPLLIRTVCPEIVDNLDDWDADCDVERTVMEPFPDVMVETRLTVGVPAGSFYPNATISDDWFIQLIYHNNDADDGDDVNIDDVPPCANGSTPGEVNDPDDLNGGDYEGIIFTGTGITGNGYVVADDMCPLDLSPDATALMVL